MSSSIPKGSQRHIGQQHFNVMASSSFNLRCELTHCFSHWSAAYELSFGGFFRVCYMRESNQRFKLSIHPWTVMCFCTLLQDELEWIYLFFSLLILPQSWGILVGEKFTKSLMLILELCSRQTIQSWFNNTDHFACINFLNLLHLTVSESLQVEQCKAAFTPGVRTSDRFFV